MKNREGERQRRVEGPALVQLFVVLAFIATTGPPVMAEEMFEGGDRELEAGLAAVPNTMCTLASWGTAQHETHTEDKYCGAKEDHLHRASEEECEVATEGTGVAEKKLGESERAEREEPAAWEIEEMAAHGPQEAQPVGNTADTPCRLELADCDNAAGSEPLPVTEVSTAEEPSPRSTDIDPAALVPTPASGWAVDEQADLVQSLPEVEAAVLQLPEMVAYEGEADSVDEVSTMGEDGDPPIDSVGLPRADTPTFAYGDLSEAVPQDDEGTAEDSERWETGSSANEEAAEKAEPVLGHEVEGLLPAGEEGLPTVMAREDIPAVLTKSPPNPDVDMSGTLLVTHLSGSGPTFEAVGVRQVAGQLPPEGEVEVKIVSADVVAALVVESVHGEEKEIELIDAGEAEEHEDSEEKAVVEERSKEERWERMAASKKQSREQIQGAVGEEETKHDEVVTRRLGEGEQGSPAEGAETVERHPNRTSLAAAQSSSATSTSAAPILVDDSLKGPKDVDAVVASDGEDDEEEGEPDDEDSDENEEDEEEDIEDAEFARPPTSHEVVEGAPIAKRTPTPESAEKARKLVERKFLLKLAKEAAGVANAPSEVDPEIRAWKRRAKLKNKEAKLRQDVTAFDMTNTAARRREMERVKKQKKKDQGSLRYKKSQ